MERIPEQVLDVCKKLKNHKVFIVGGAVRDTLLGKTPHDWDVATSATPDDLADLFPDSKRVGEHFGVILVGGIEVATFRYDGVYSDGRHPDSVKFSTSIDDDLARRDFTINAMAMDPFTREIINPFNGKQDLKDGIIRTVWNPKERFQEDKLRVLRAVRFQSQFGFKIEELTKKHLNQLLDISKERIQTEFMKILRGPHFVEAIETLYETGLLFQLFPSTKGYSEPHDTPYHLETYKGLNDIWAHIHSVLENVNSEDPLIRLACLLHDVGKPLCRFVSGHSSFVKHDVVGANIVEKEMEALRFSNAEVELVTNLVRDHMNYHNLPKMKDVVKIRRFLGKKYFEQLRILGDADTRGTLNPYPVALMGPVIEKYRSQFPDMLPYPNVTGATLITMGLEKGPAYKRTMELCYNEQLRGKTLTSKQIKGIFVAVSREIENENKLSRN